MLYTSLSDAAADVAERIAAHREILFSVQLSPEAWVPSSVIRMIFEKDPRLLLCIDTIQMRVQNFRAGINLLFEIEYTKVMPSSVCKVSSVSEFKHAVLRGVGLHRREVFVVFPKSLARAIRNETGDFMKNPDVLRCYVNGMQTEFQSKPECSYQALRLVWQYTCTYSEWRNRAFESEKAVAVIARIANAAGTEDWRKAYAVVSYCVDHWQYGTDATFPGIQYTAYGALVKQQAVCMGISLAICEIFKALGIPCRYISGKRNGVGHAWNMVYIRQGWFYLDVTDAIGRKDPLFHWGMTVCNDRTIQHTCKETLVCNCDAAFIRQNIRKREREQRAERR